jgi:thiol-disulfide isomerase/thioredoxin
MGRLTSLIACLCGLLAMVPILTAQAPAASTPSAPAPLNYSPTNSNAQKSYDDGLKLLEKGRPDTAVDAFRRADQLDGGHCFMCELEAWDSAMQDFEFQYAEDQSKIMLGNVTAPAMKAQAEYMLGKATLSLGIQVDGDSQLEEADAAFQAAVQLKPNYFDSIYEDGIALAYLKRDEQATTRFKSFLKLAGPDELNYGRAQRLSERPELARTKLAPNFRVTTLDGKTITLESFAGKVVLIDFWAMWCPPCHRALPHLQKIAQEYAGQPFVVLSISLDPDDGKWREFTSKNHMTWPQYRDGGYDGKIATLFGVRGIPNTIIVDANGVFKEQDLGSADIDGKIKELVARAVEASAHALLVGDPGATAARP